MTEEEPDFYDDAPDEPGGAESTEADPIVDREELQAVLEAFDEATTSVESAEWNSESGLFT